MKKKLIIERTYDADLQKVWDSFTNVETLLQWWAPATMSCAHVTVDLKKGGLFHFCFKAEDGKEFWSRGIYEHIDAPRKLSYLDSFADKEGNAVAPSHYGMPNTEISETLVEFAFTANDNGTLVVMSGDNLYDEAMTDQVRMGWNSMFDQLVQLLKA